MVAYYNEHDKQKAAWLRELIARNLIAPGDVDERSIEDIKPDELSGYTQCHFFAGIGVWPYALRLAGWPDDKPAWTGSCPCQPFSAAGKRAGIADVRHLWPAWHHLIAQRGPSVVFGEQVASKDGETWLDLVYADMEGLGYAFGPIVLPAAGVGAPHGRHRIYFVADTPSERQLGWWSSETGDVGNTTWVQPERLRSFNELGDTFRKGLEGQSGYVHDKKRRKDKAGPATEAGLPRFVGDASIERRGEAWRVSLGHTERTANAGPTNGFWEGAEWLLCRDEARPGVNRCRPVMSGTFPLASGASARMVRIRGYGDAINAEVAKAFIESYIETRGV